MSEGWIFQINVSPGGVPKLPVARAGITPDGVEGDKQRNTKYHGGRDRAVCLYSLERILALQSKGHPIYPGATGENVTIAGLDWELLEPGTRLRLGDGVLLEITSYTTPCSHITDAFADGQSGRLAQQQNPGWSRLYARVLEPGQVQIGSRLTVLSPAGEEVMP